MNKKERFNLFLKRANEKHGDRFDYSLVEYKTQKDHIKIICKKHGIFQQTPDKHLQSKYCCDKCSNLNKGTYDRSNIKKISKYNLQYSKECLLKKFKDRFTYDFSKFNNTHDGIVICRCNIHGIFEQSLKRLLFHNNKSGCIKCANKKRSESKTKNYQNFINKANTIYDNLYEYPYNDYFNRKSIITIICKKHGEFQKRAQKHLSGQGCFKCCIEKLIEENKLPGGYCEQNFKNNEKLKNKNGCLYYFKVGNLYKIGITTNLDKRIESIKYKSKKQIIKIFLKNDTLYDCYILEQEILQKFNYCRVYRSWSTELFNENIFLNKNLWKY